MATAITNLGRQVGATILVLDENNLFHNTLDTKCIKRWKSSYNMLCLSLLIGFFLIPKFWYEHNIERYTLSLLYISGGTAIILVMFSMFRWHSHDCVRLINGMLEFLRYMERTYMPNVNREKDKLNWFVDALVFITGITLLIMMAAIVLLCIYDPTSLVFFGAWIPPKYYSFFPIGLLICIHHAYFMFVAGVNAAIALGIYETYFVYVTVIFTNELKLSTKHNFCRTSDNLRNDPNNLRHVYRCFQILNANVMCAAGKFVASAHVLCIIIPVLCNFILIHYWNSLSLLAKVPIMLGLPVSMGYWTLVLQLGKYWFVRSNKILHSWTRKSWDSKKETTVMKKFRRSCRPIVIHWDNILVVGRMTQFNYIKSILKCAFKALLTAKS